VKLHNLYSAASTYNCNDKVREKEVGIACSTGIHTTADLCSICEDHGSQEPSSRQQCRLYICHNMSVENDVLPSGIQGASMTGMDTHLQEL
jgi:hypothetical protein